MSETSSGGVEVQVQSQLSKIIADLQAIQKASEGVSAQTRQMGDDVGKKIKEGNDEVGKGLQKTQSIGRRVADQLRKDFASLFAVGSLTSGLKLADQFQGSVKESVNLSDTVRRLSSVFGIAGKDFVHFQNLMISGLGEIGLGSESAANALKGLAETPVRGEKNLLAYAKTAGQLASISGEKGQEGSIAKGAAGVITARGGNVNDQQQLGSVTREMLQIRQATGKGFNEISQVLQELYSKTNRDFQGQLKGGGSTTLATAALSGGPQATAFLEKYLSMSRIERKGAEAQGLGQIVGKNGQLNIGAIMSTMNEAKGRGLGDAQAGLKTMGLSDDEAKGFIRLADAMERSGTAINKAKEAQVDLNEEYRKTMGLGDAFRANINKVKQGVSSLISGGSTMLTEGLEKASHSGLGAAAVTAGAATLAAMLTGGGLRGIGRGLGDEAKTRAIEAATGEKVQRVEVINWPAGGIGGIGGLGGSAGGLAGVGGMASKASGVLGGAALAASAGMIAGDVAQYVGTGQIESDTSDLIKRMKEFFTGKEKPVSGGFGSPGVMADVKVKVEFNKKDLRVTPLPGRGSSN